jgi:hypothetical protein
VQRAQSARKVSRACCTEGLLGIDMSKDYRVQISWGGGSKSWEYFETLAEADLHVPPPRFDFMGYPKRPNRLTVQQKIDGKWKQPESTGKVRLQIRGGRIQVTI